MLIRSKGCIVRLQDSEYRCGLRSDFEADYVCRSDVARNVAPKQINTARILIEYEFM
jgi:hypothetical protein